MSSVTVILFYLTGENLLIYFSINIVPYDSPVACVRVCVCWQTAVSGVASYVDSISASANTLNIKCPLSVKDFRTRGARPVRSP